MLVNGEHYHSIWLNNDDQVEIIDQTCLPHEFRIVRLESVDAVCHAIQSMQVRGAGLIGVTAGFGVYVAAKNYPQLLSFEQGQEWMEDATAKILATRPTATNLAWAINRQRKNWFGKAPQEALSLIRQEALAIKEEDIQFAKQIGVCGCEKIAAIAQHKNGEPVNILTHCNAGWLAFADYGSALAPIYTAAEAGINLHVWVDETRPRNQGASLTAWELGQQGVAHTLIADNAGGHLMQHGLVDMCLVGADRVTRTGDVANKIGTYLKALAAKDNNIPFYVALPSSTFDFTLTNGVIQIPIEERNGLEVETMCGVPCDEKGNITEMHTKQFRICPSTTKARNYAFDVTPAHLVSGLITERGICLANEQAITTLFADRII